MTKQSQRRMVTIAEISEYLKIKKPTLYSWVQNGTIPAYKLNKAIRFDMDEIEEWIKLSKHEPGELPNIGPRNISSTAVDDIVSKAIESVTGKKPKTRKKK